MRTFVSTAFMQFLAREATRGLGWDGVGAHPRDHPFQDALPLFGVGGLRRHDAKPVDGQFNLGAFGKVAGGLRDEYAVAVDCLECLRHCLTPLPPFYTVTASRYSPQTRRRRWEISPTVASASTQERMRGRRLSVERAASSRRVRATSVFSASRRARKGRTRSTCARSTAGAVRSVGPGVSASARKRLTPTTDRKSGGGGKSGGFG